MIYRLGDNCLPSGGVGMGVFGGKYSSSDSTGGLFDPGLGLCDLLSVLLADLWPRTVYTWSRGLPRGLGGPDPRMANLRGNNI